NNQSNDEYGNQEEPLHYFASRTARAYSFATSSIIRSVARWMLFSSERRPSVIRKLPSATSGASPIAVETCERVPLFAAQALLVATNTSRDSSARRTRSASSFGNERCTCPAIRCFW